jgi:hypothetical protein
MTDAGGFDLRTQKLLCLILLDDTLASLLSDNAGEGFFRAFIVEDRATGEIVMNQRFRYVDGDSWSRVRLNPERQKLSRAERVTYLQEGIESILRMALFAFSRGAAVPHEAVRCFYPPNPDGDSQLTLDWLIAEDLVYVAKIEKTEEAQ